MPIILLIFISLLIMPSTTSLSPPPKSSAVSVSIGGLGLESQASSSVQLPSSVTSQKRDRNSYIWSHMPGSINTIYTNSKNVVVWRCGLCSKEYTERGGTTAPKGHLLKYHAIDDPLKGVKQQAQTTSIVKAFERGREATNKRRKFHNSFDLATFKELFVRWISRCSIPYRMSTIPEFRDLLAFLNEDVEAALPANGDTIRSWTMETFRNERQRVQQAVQSAASKVHFTVDLWTSSNSLALLGMIAHYFTENGQLCQSVLALRELEGQHTGENQAQLIMKVIEEYGIASKVGYFMMDNAENNETMMRALSTSKDLPPFLLIRY
jgi:hypothetical protein